MSGSSSSCKCTSWGFQQSSATGSKLGVKPTCVCGQNAVFRIAITPENKGKRFWGCPNFKGGSFDVIDEGVCFLLPQGGSLLPQEERSASARNEEVGGSLMKMEQSLMKMEERDVEKLKIACLKKSLVILEKWLKVLMGMMFVTCVCNVIVISMLMKLG
ncbi:uncharacterized protein HKW66_Vig0118230 [Vigna angularis]|uniref:GRF-type domain-containing protein n=1 Tax=Phaseolus angularis TaxID=3914 RepID=A0A8T0JYL6_PHAAN|nr:uncharacterized protein HKW66_Vig0118230 [Vigna angularis]